jgi:hypothetical protein
VATVLPTSSDEYLELVRANAPKYFQGESDLTFRSRIWMALMEKYGVIDYGVDTSYACVWDVIYRLPEVSTFGDSGDINFDEHSALQQLTVNVRGYKATDRLPKKQYLLNRGSTRISNLYKGKSERLLKSMRHNLCSEIYTDGYATGNTHRLIGLESFLGSGTVAAGDRVAKTDDSYGGLTTDLGDYGGTWSDSGVAASQYNATLSNDWPYGQGSPEYDFISPLLVNYSSTAWPSGSTSFIDNCEDVLRFAILAQRHRGAIEGSGTPLVNLMGTRLYNDVLTYYSARNVQHIPVPDAVQLGFPETINFEGAWLTHDYDCGANVGYIIQPDMMELFTPQSQLFEVEGPEWSTPDQAFLYIVSMFGNMRFSSPKFFGKLAAYA